MALNAFLTLVGRKSGEIQGSVTQKGREGKIMVIAASHEITTPRGDAASGMSTGKRMHTPFVITKEVDRSSVPLHRLQTGNENLREWELQFWTPQLKADSGTGAEMQYFTIKLTNASIASITMRMPNNKHPDLMKLESFEEVSFSYEKIEWTWTDGAMTASDEWRTGSTEAPTHGRGNRRRTAGARCRGSASSEASDDGRESHGGGTMG